MSNPKQPSSMKDTVTEYQGQWSKFLYGRDGKYCLSHALSPIHWWLLPETMCWEGFWIQIWDEKKKKSAFLISNAVYLEYGISSSMLINCFPEEKKKKKALICIVCQFPWCKYSQHSEFQATKSFTSSSQSFWVLNNQFSWAGTGQFQHITST